jgi:TolB-like protein
MNHSRRAIIALLGAALVVPSRARAGDACLAVLYFENISQNKELDALAVALSEMLIVDLAGEAGVRIVERQHLQRLFDELELGHSGNVDPGTAASVGRLLGARWLLLGSYLELFGSLRINSRLVDVETGEILFATAVQGVSAEFLGMAAKLGGAHKGDLSHRTSTSPPSTPPLPAHPSSQGEPAPRPTPIPTAPARSSTYAKSAPPAMRAALALSDGLVALDSGDKAGAKVALDEAVALQPDMKAARSALEMLSM